MANNADLPLAATFMNPFGWKSNIEFLCFGKPNENAPVNSDTPCNAQPPSDTLWIMYEVILALANSHLVAFSESTHPYLDYTYAMGVCGRVLIVNTSRLNVCKYE